MTPRRIAAVAAVLACPATAQTGTAFADLPGTTFQYYDVTGTDDAAIQASLLKRRPTDPQDGKRVDALTQTWLKWSWPVRDGRCRLDRTVVTVTSTIQLPRLRDRATLPPDLLRRWDAYIVALEAHEARHVRFSHDGRADILAAIRAATCATANDAAKAALAVIQARDIALDRTTNHGEDDIAHF